MPPRDFAVQFERIAEHARGADALLHTARVAAEVERNVGACDEAIHAPGDRSVIERVERHVRAADEKIGADHVDSDIRGAAVRRIGRILFRTYERGRIPGVASAPFFDDASDGDVEPRLWIELEKRLADIRALRAALGGIAAQLQVELPGAAFGSGVEEGARVRRAAAVAQAGD